MESGDNTCTYDTTFATAGTSLTMTRTGYEFKGWRVRPEMDFSTLTSLSTGDEKWDKIKLKAYKTINEIAKVASCFLDNRKIIDKDIVYYPVNLYME